MRRYNCLQADTVKMLPSIINNVLVNIANLGVIIEGDWLPRKYMKWSGWRRMPGLLEVRRHNGLEIWLPNSLMAGMVCMWHCYGIAGLFSAGRSRVAS